MLLTELGCPVAVVANRTQKYTRDLDIVVAFNVHPNNELDNRTNTYYMHFIDGGETWLNAARHDLLRGDYGSARVVEIASGWGFTHMGQFSSDYRHMFGEKPSETLRRTPSHNGV